MHSRLLVLTFLLALVYFISAGSPDCNRGSSDQSRGISVLAETLEYTGEINTLGGVPTLTLKNIPELATSVSDLPATDDGFTGPHNDNRGTKSFYSKSGIGSVSCQIDCLSTVIDEKKGNRRLMMANCKNRFYSYGIDAKHGCFSQFGILDLQAHLAFGVCTQYSGCTQIYMPKNPVKTLQTAKGKNSFGAFMLKIFKGLVIAGKAIEKAAKWLGGKMKVGFKKVGSAFKKGFSKKTWKKVGGTFKKLGKKIGGGIKKFFRRIRW
jgi:hypothetical protein